MVSGAVTAATKQALNERRRNRLTRNKRRSRLQENQTAKTKSVFPSCLVLLPPAACLLDWCPATAFIRGAGSVEHKLHAISILECGCTCNCLSTGAECSNDLTGQCREASR